MLVESRAQVYRNMRDTCLRWIQTMSCCFSSIGMHLLPIAALRMTNLLKVAFGFCSETTMLQSVCTS
ncbi:hypothetical protein AVEN_33850-1 [Araneus ventricosus]|uniref:Uncharacterized protein n=1 Tax=Araneus ventricosus TaxID=182803 RepID=A0A4Y2J384_ARAVE|nr:hypothetical protein AVEN_33850-1 [Araneus ventricosus]